MQILVVDDDKKTARIISQALASEGFSATVLHRGHDAFATLQSAPFDVVVLDIMLPDTNGLNILRQLRASGNATPVLLLSARGEVNERVEGLKTGADDYLSKPFAVEELIARIEILAHRSMSAKLSASALQMADLTLDIKTRTAHRAGRKIELTVREYRLLEYLMSRPGQVCSRMMIFENVWDYNYDPGTNIIDVYVRKLRDKIDNDFSPKLFHSVRGVGYLMKVES